MKTGLIFSKSLRDDITHHFVTYYYDGVDPEYTEEEHKLERILGLLHNLTHALKDLFVNDKKPWYKIWLANIATVLAWIPMFIFGTLGLLFLYTKEGWKKLRANLNRKKV